MSKRLLISEEEKSSILNLYNILSEEKPTPTQLPKYTPTGGYKVDPNYDSQKAMSQLRAAPTYTQSVDTYSSEWCRNNKVDVTSCINVFCQRNPSKCKTQFENSFVSVVTTSGKQVLSLGKALKQLLQNGNFVEFFNKLREFLTSWIGLAANVVLDIFTDGISGVVLWGLIFLNDVNMYIMKPRPKEFSWGRLFMDFMAAATAGFAAGASVAAKMENMTLKEIVAIPEYKKVLFEFYTKFKAFVPSLKGIWKTLKKLVEKFPKIQTYFLTCEAGLVSILDDLAVALGQKAADLTAKVGEKVANKLIRKSTISTATNVGTNVASSI